MQQSWRARFPHMVGVLLSAILLMVIASLISTPASAKGTTTVISRATPSNSVTILVLDMSGSMAVNDPDGLRCSAANAYIDLSGPGNFIGVIGLDLGTGTAAHNFQAAQVWTQQPMEMATLAERQQLQNIIATKSNNCKPDSDTPTYDALDKALQMLNSATNGGQVPGSVVLLTDGVPAPDTINQMNAIQTELLPQFKQHSWPIDTVALGTDDSVPGTNTTFHSFLSGLSDATSGSFYDDGHGLVPNVSPLNIADFFVNIFARHNHRIVKNDIPPTTLNGGTTRRNFSVTDYTNSLDVTVVKDQANTQAALITPNGQVISQSGSGVFISSFDPHYVIFSIDRPQPGLWELDVTGSGQFLMDSLKISGIGLSAISVSQANLTASATSALAIGQPLRVSANLTNNGQPITDDRFTLNGTITYKGALGTFTQKFALDDKDNPGTYVGNVTIPSTAPPGTYEIVIAASAVSAEAVVSSQNLSIRVELFPVPLLNSSQGVGVQWDPFLRTFYRLPFWPVTQLGQWALSGLPAQGVDLAGQVQLRQQSYPTATVTAVASEAGSHNTVPVTVVNEGGGNFHVVLPSESSGTYNLTFKTQGTFAESHGDFGATQTTVQISLIPATLEQESRAWLLTLGYLLCLVFFYYCVRWMIYPYPRGSWLRYHEGELIESFEFWRATRNPLQGFFHRDLLRSRQAKMPAGLLLRFRRGGGIEVRGHGSASANWQRSDGSTISHEFREVSEVRYRPAGTLDDGAVTNDEQHLDIDETSTYAFTAQVGQKKPDLDGYEEDDFRPSRPRKRLDDEDTSSVRSTRKRPKRTRDVWDEDF